MRPQKPLTGERRHERYAFGPVSLNAEFSSMTNLKLCPQWLQNRKCNQLDSSNTHSRGRNLRV